MILPFHPVDRSRKFGWWVRGEAREKVKEHQSIRKKLALTYRVYPLPVCGALMEAKQTRVECEHVFCHLNQRGSQSVSMDTAENLWIERAGHKTKHCD